MNKIDKTKTVYIHLLLVLPELNFFSNTNIKKKKIYKMVKEQVLVRPELHFLWGTKYYKTKNAYQKKQYTFPVSWVTTSLSLSHCLSLSSLSAPLPLDWLTRHWSSSPPPVVVVWLSLRVRDS